ncbi:PREDICTED: transcription factor 25-like [Camelina sativa]|uniref:Transcription factor 25-like n=1 Tax=Camelina sativa TaxID=90675 RepID=A0ABM0ZNU4_CAMSA|nr:PREDICTED: transcription factor 25-like [Camelina sativa]
MSGRLLKRVLQEHEESKQQIHHEEEEEDEESGARSSINPFDLLNEDDEDLEEIEIDDETIVEKKKEDGGDHLSKNVDNVQPVSKNKSKKKKTKKNKETSSNVAKPDISLDETLEALGLSANSKQDKETKANADSSKMASSSRFVLEIDPKYLNLENELRRVYGSKAMRSFESGTPGGGSSRLGRGGRRGVHNITKTVLISPKENWSRWDRSFSMEFLETKDGNNYFRYTHSASYEQAQRAFQAAQAIHDLNGVASVLIHHPYHIESLITMADYFKFVGEHDMAADAIGKCLYGLERAWHPMFTPFQGNCRLDFNHDTNKLFFKTLFTHLRNMDRRGCHRSALEVCKLLLSLDTSDPVGALFCVDYFALRAEEYAWLEQFSEEYRNDNSLWLFPNFSYSLAIARVFLEKIESSSSSEATHIDTSKSSSLDLMKQALKLHPTVLRKLVDKVPLKDQVWTKILKHSYFRSDESKIMSLDHLINIYVERNYLIWRLPDVQKLLRSAADLVIESLEQDGTEAESWLCVRKEAFSAENNQYSHLSTHDFSDSMPTLPPDNLQNFVANPRMVGGGQQQAPPPPPRDLANRNALAVLIESILPWAHYGDEGDDAHHQPDNNG